MGPVIASLGELLVEFVCTETASHHARPAPYMGPFPSGAPGIFIDQVARMTGRAMFAGAVGGDAFGRVILDRLRGAGVDNRLIRVIPDRPTGTAHVAYNSDGSREFVFNIAHSAAAGLPGVDEIAAGFCGAGVQVLHISGSTLSDAALRATALDLCRKLAAAGVAISIDPNIRPELMRDNGYTTALRAIVDLADYVLPSDADAEVLWPGRDFSAMADSLPRARAVVLKRGARGCIGRAAGETVTRAAHAVTVVDPTGAGDCFCATFVAAMAQGRPLAQALAWANAAGALAVSALGPMEGNAPPERIAALAGSD